MFKKFLAVLSVASCLGCMPQEAGLRQGPDPRLDEMAKEQKRLSMRMDELAQGLLDVKTRLERLERTNKAPAKAVEQEADKAPPAQTAAPVFKKEEALPPPTDAGAARAKEVEKAPRLEVIKLEPPKPMVLEAPQPGKKAAAAQAKDGKQAAPTPEAQAAPPPAPAPAPMGTDDASKLYQRAFNSYRQGQYAKAILDFEEFVTKYPDHQHADSAQFWIGESYYSQNEYDQAIVEFSRVTDRYPQGVRAPDAYLMIAGSYEKLGQPDRARAFYKRLVTQYPGSEASAKAEGKLKESP